MRNRISSTLAVSAFALTALGAMATPAAAGDWVSSSYGYASCCRYEKVVRYELQKQYETRWETVYDRYGCPHQVLKTYSHYVKVPVVKLAKVCQ